MCWKPFTSVVRSHLPDLPRVAPNLLPLFFRIYQKINSDLPDLPPSFWRIYRKINSDLPDLPPSFSVGFTGFTTLKTDLPDLPPSLIYIWRLRSVGPRVLVQ